MTTGNSSPLSCSVRHIIDANVPERDKLGMLLSNRITHGGADGALIHVKAFDALINDLIAWKDHAQKTEVITVNLKTIYETPELVQTLEQDELWDVANGMADQFSEGVTDTVFERMMLVILAIPRIDFACITLRMIKERNKETFKIQLRKCTNFEKFKNDYARYVIDW